MVVYTQNTKKQKVFVLFLTVVEVITSGSVFVYVCMFTSGALEPFRKELGVFPA